MSVPTTSESDTGRRLLVVALVVVVVLTGLPIVLNMGGMVACEDCAPALVQCGPACAVAPVAAVGLAAAAFAVVAFVGRRRRAGLLYAWAIEPPPRLA